MRVYISAYTCAPLRGSEPGNGWQWILNYSRHGFNTEVLTSGKYRSEIDAVKNDLDCNVSFHFIDNKLTLRLLGIPFFGIYFHYFVWLYRTHRILQRKTSGSDTSHYHHVTFSNIKLGTPLFDIHGVSILGPLGGASICHHSLKPYFGSHWISEKFKESLSSILSNLNVSVKASLRSASYCLVSNHETAEYVKNFSNVPMEIMPDAGLPDYFKMNYTLRTITEYSTINILWVGRFLPRKGLNLAIIAFKRLIDMNADHNFMFNILGDGPMRQECENLVAKYSLKDRVKFLGKKPHNLLVKEYLDSHVFLFPSLKDSCPMQVFEAMATGLPVVTLNHQGMSDQVVEGAGIKVNVGDNIDYPTELAKSIYQIICSQETYNAYSKCAFIHGQKQIWSSRISKFLNNTLPKIIYDQKKYNHL